MRGAGWVMGVLVKQEVEQSPLTRWLLQPVGNLSKPRLWSHTYTV